jgi:serine/threonine-protein kinase RsbW
LRPSEPDGFSWIELPGTTDNLPYLQEFILDRASRHQASPDILLKMEMVLEEVLLNIINHGYSGDRTGIIKAGCALSDQEGFVIRIIDHGAPFDPSSRPDPDTSLSVEDRDIGGLGIFLVRKMSDHVEYQRSDGQNILDISFRL